jgi:hypothetical protein
VSLDDERTRAKATPSGPDRQFSDLELRDRLEKAIARLPANYRLLIAAHYLNGVQYEGLAEALQLPLGTVKTQLFRAKQQLRRMWKRISDDSVGSGFSVQGAGTALNAEPGTRPMFCDEALDTVEAIAAGDVMPDGPRRVRTWRAARTAPSRSSARGSSRRRCVSGRCPRRRRNSHRGRSRAFAARDGAAISSWTWDSTWRSA